MANAGTVTVTRIEGNANEPKIIQFDWLSTAGGAARLDGVSIAGELSQIITIPATGGDAPDVNYDIQLLQIVNVGWSATDSEVDILNAKAANRHNSNTEYIYIDGTTLKAPIFLQGTYSFDVQNAGATNQGTMLLFYR